MEKTLRKRILAHMDCLTVAEKQLGQVILGLQSNISAYSGTELAALAQVSEPTVGRFMRRLGYKNFREARTLDREETDQASPLFLATTLPGNHPLRSAFADHLNHELRNLTQTFKNISTKHVGKIIHQLKEARHIYVAGSRNGHILAQYAFVLFSQLRSKVKIIPGSHSGLVEELADLHHEDVVFMFDFRRRSPLVEKVLGHAVQVGTHIVILTDSFLTPPPILSSSVRAAMIVQCHTQGSGAFDSYNAVLSLINFIASSLTRTMGDEALARLEKIEELHEYYADLK